MNDLLWPRVFAAFLEDTSLAVLCGLMLSSYWRKVRKPEDRGSEITAIGPAVFSSLLFLAACGQLLFLASSFSGQTSLRLVLASMPDVCSTHAGGLSLGLCAVAAALCIAIWIPGRRRGNFVYALLLLGCLGLHTCIGHAAADGVFSLSELLQGIHLLGMGLWSGGVIVAGLFVVPRLLRKVVAHQADEFAGAEPRASCDVREYLGRLSVTSTWSVGAVIVTGILKSYRATDGSLPPIVSSHWGHILLGKIALVTLTVLLGARNRWLLATGDSGDLAILRRIVRTLRAESVCMLGVLLLSAWLANSPPPLE